jgi:hypothetical protein
LAGPGSHAPGFTPGQIGGRNRSAQDSDPVARARGLGADSIQRRERFDDKVTDESPSIHQSITSSVDIGNDAGLRGP